MKELLTLRLLPAFGVCALIALSLGACDDCCDDDDDDDDDFGGSIPVFFEVEPNDTPGTANDFGFLTPGDEFIIDGFITDNGFDPFDGFWFTSTGPIHVDFQLFIDNPAADLDVCLYDPLLDATISCYQTANNPEQGGIDITDGDVDFQLVVESFVGQSDYSLEIVVVPLAPLPPAASPAVNSTELASSDAAPPARLKALHPRKAVAREGAGAQAFDAYAHSERQIGVKKVTRSHFDVDTELGLVIETTIIEEVPIVGQVEQEGQSVKVR